MESDYFEKEYEEIFDAVYPYIENNQKGTLSTVIYYILDESHARQLCQNYGIEPNTSIDDDLDIFDDLIYTVTIDRQKNINRTGLEPGLKILKNLSKPIRKQLINHEDKMELIVFAAISLIGVYVSSKFLNKNRLKNTSSSNAQEISSSGPTRKLAPTAICLAVPASEVSDLTEGELINRNKIIQLIDAASDFLCLKKEEAEKLPIDIDKNQNPSPDSKLKFYIRIDIADGRKIIRKETKYVIKRDLLPNTKGEIIDIGRLKSISSISSFNRI